VNRGSKIAKQAMPTALHEESQIQTQAQIAALSARHEKEKETP
jgi:hypothetical protein